MRERLETVGQVCDWCPFCETVQTPVQTSEFATMGYMALWRRRGEAPTEPDRDDQSLPKRLERHTPDQSSPSQ